MSVFRCKKFIILICILGISVIAGCLPEIEFEMEQVRVIESDVEFQILPSYETAAWVIRQNDKAKWLISISEDRGIDRFDDEDFTYVYIGSGYKPTRDYHVALREIKHVEDENKLIFSAIDQAPPGEAPIQDNYPRIVIKIERTDLEFELQWIEEDEVGVDEGE